VRSAVASLWLLLLMVTAFAPMFAGAQAVSPAAATGDRAGYWQSPTPTDLLREVRHQSEELTTAATEADWENGFVAVGAAEAALERLRALMEEPVVSADGRRLERRFIDADSLGDLLAGAEAALRSRELSALMLFGGEVTELADRMLANCEFQ
jgi:hypothetical protein